MFEILKAIRDKMAEYTNYTIELGQLKGTDCFAISVSSSTPIYDLGTNYQSKLSVVVNVRADTQQKCLDEMEKIKSICNKRIDLPIESSYTIPGIDILTDTSYTGREEKKDYMFSMILNVQITRKES